MLILLQSINPTIIYLNPNRMTYTVIVKIANQARRSIIRRWPENIGADTERLKKRRPRLIRKMLQTLFRAASQRFKTFKVIRAKIIRTSMSHLTKFIMTRSTRVEGLITSQIQVEVENKN